MHLPIFQHCEKQICYQHLQVLYQSNISTNPTEFIGKEINDLINNHNRLYQINVLSTTGG